MIMDTRKDAHHCYLFKKSKSKPQWIITSHLSVLDLYPEKNENSTSKDICTSMFISEWMKVSQSYPTICNPIDYSPPGSSVHGILQARYGSGLPLHFSRGSSRPCDQAWISCIAGWFFTTWATKEALSMFAAALFTIEDTEIIQAPSNRWSA